MNLEAITPLILTYNEEPNLGRVLDRLTWATRVIVLDSGSTDGTREIASRYPNAEWMERPFDSFAQQCNHGLSLITSPWVLSLDADYVLSPGFEQKVAALPPEPTAAGYRVPFRYLIEGRPLRASLYPPRTVLYRRAAAHYENDGHGHRVQITGPTQCLETWIDHDDRKPLSRWVVSQDRYAALEAQKLLSTPSHELRLQDRLRRTGWAAIPATLIYTLLIKRTLFDGWRGWFYALQRTFAEILLALRLIEARFTRQAGPRKGP